MIFITDGSIDNEAALIEQVAGSIGQRRLFTVGIGASTQCIFYGIRGDDRQGDIYLY